MLYAGENDENLPGFVPDDAPLNKRQRQLDKEAREIDANSCNAIIGSREFMGSTQHRRCQSPLYTGDVKPRNVKDRITGVVRQVGGTLFGQKACPVHNPTAFKPKTLAAIRESLATVPGNEFWDWSGRVKMPAPKTTRVKKTEGKPLSTNITGSSLDAGVVDPSNPLDVQAEDPNNTGSRRRIPESDKPYQRSTSYAIKQKDLLPNYTYGLSFLGAPEGTQGMAVTYRPGGGTAFSQILNIPLVKQEGYNEMVATSPNRVSPHSAEYLMTGNVDPKTSTIADYVHWADKNGHYIHLNVEHCDMIDHQGKSICDAHGIPHKNARGDVGTSDLVIHMDHRTPDQKDPSSRTFVDPRTSASPVTTHVVPGWSTHFSSIAPKTGIMLQDGSIRTLNRGRGPAVSNTLGRVFKDEQKPGNLFRLNGKEDDDEPPIYDVTGYYGTTLGDAYRMFGGGDNPKMLNDPGAEHPPGSAADSEALALAHAQSVASGEKPHRQLDPSRMLDCPTCVSDIKRSDHRFGDHVVNPDPGCPTCNPPKTFEKFS